MAKKIRKKGNYPRTCQEAHEFMVERYQQIDSAITSELATFERTGTRPTCSRGCSHCCRQLVPAAPIEGMALIHFIKTALSLDQQTRIVERNNNWFDWRNNELPNHIRRGASAESAHYDNGPFCPLLENNECSAYPGRPLACRGHFVTSDPRGCRPTGDSEYIPNIFRQLVIVSPIPIAKKIRTLSLKEGIDPLIDGKLIPEWLLLLQSRSLS